MCNRIRRNIIRLIRMLREREVCSRVERIRYASRRPAPSSRRQRKRRNLRRLQSNLRLECRLEGLELRRRLHDVWYVLGLL